MRVTRYLLLLSAIALAVAGCAAQPVAYMPMVAPSTLDGMTYGQAAAPAPAPVYGRGFAYPAPTYAAATYPTAAYPTAAYQQAPTYAAPPAAPAYSGGYYNYAGANRAYPAAPAVVPAQPAYTMDAGDRLRVTVFGQDGLTNAYVVGASGYIAMPLIGQVMARGLTTDQLSARIAEKLKDGFIREPHVAVEIEAYRPFFILGEVTQPGQYPFVANMTAETAVAIAGGFTPRASRQSVTLTRNYNGQQVRISVPVTYELRPGDTVTVHERWF